MDAALDLGASPSQALRKVLLPQIRTALLSASLIAFTMSFDDFIISYFVTGQGVANLSILVYTMSKRINPSVNALSSLLILALLLGLLTLQHVKKNKRSRL